MTKAELMSLVGHKVRVKLFDDKRVYEGELSYWNKLETIDNLKGVFMEKDKLMSYVDKKVKLVLFDGTVLEGVLCYESGEFNYYHAFSIGGFSFRWCEVSKVKEV